MTTFVPQPGPLLPLPLPAPPPPDLAPSCAEAGVLGVLPGLIGLFQANEAIKLILGIGEPLNGRLLTFDALGTTLSHAQAAARPRLPRLPRGREDRVHRLRAVLLGGRMSLPEEIDCRTLKQMLDGPAEARPVVIDVRQQREHQLAPFPGATLIPLHELAERAEELVNHKGKPVVMVCHTGRRSLAAAAFARDKGLDATSLAGGIEAWACEIDPKVPRY